MKALVAAFYKLLIGAGFQPISDDVLEGVETIPELMAEMVRTNPVFSLPNSVLDGSYTVEIEPYPHNWALRIAGGPKMRRGSLVLAAKSKGTPFLDIYLYPSAHTERGGGEAPSPNHAYYLRVDFAESKVHFAQKRDIMSDDKGHLDRLIKLFATALETAPELKEILEHSDHEVVRELLTLTGKAE